MTNEEKQVRFAHKLALVIRLCRFENCCALGLLFISSRTYYGYSAGSQQYLKAVTWMLLAAFAYVYNDLCDIAVDKVNRPDRPLPSGAISIGIAKRTLWLLGGFVIGLSVAVWRWEILWPIGSLVGSVVYSRLLRPKSALLSNLVASGLVAAVPLSALPLRGSFQAVALSIGIGFLMLARELQKDAVDIQGDSTCRPLPALSGNYAWTFQRVYPWLLAASAYLLYLATHRPTRSLIVSCWSALPVIIILTAIFLFIIRRNGHRLQSNLIKAASYLLVLILLIRTW